MKNKKHLVLLLLVILSIPLVMSACSSADTTGMWNWFVNIVSELSGGMLKSLLLFVLTIIFSMPLGLLICFARRSRFKVVELIAKFYISIMRGTPLMLQLLVVYFGPYYIFGISLTSNYRAYAAIIAFSINYAAYFAEIYRAGIEAVPKGQYEAAKVLGYSRQKTFMKIVFPQMVKHIMPPVTNEVITLVKDTSLAYAIAYLEMFSTAKQLAAAESNVLPMFVAGLFYYIFNLVVSFIMGKIEKRLSYYD